MSELESKVMKELLALSGCEGYELEAHVKYLSRELRLLVGTVLLVVTI